MARRISRWSVWVLALALMLIGCGGGDAGTQEASAAPSAQASAPPAADASESAGSQGSDGGGDGQTYVVESGDTLSAIAKRFDTTVKAIVEANDLKNPDNIDVGDEFVIPGGQ